MTLTPSVLRRDAGIKCGGGYIAQGKKCRATGGGAIPSRPGRTGGKGLRSTEGGGPSRVEKVENFIIKNGTALNRVATVGSFVAGFQGRNKLASALGKVGTVSGVASNAALYAQGARTQNEAKKAQASFGLGMTAGALAVSAHFKRQNQQATVNRIKDYRNKINKEVSALPAGIQSEARKSNHTWLKRHIKESTGNLPLSAARRRKTKPVPLKQQLRSLWADGFSYNPSALAM